MATADFSFERDVWPVAIRTAKRAFQGRWDCDEMVADATHEAWLFWQAKPTAPPGAIAKFAVRRVIGGRHFRQSTRSCEGPNPRRLNKPQRVEFDVLDVLATSDDPAELAAFRVDFSAWLESLTPRKRAIVLAIVCGLNGNELATEFGLSAGRITQIRRELFTDWLTANG